MYIHSDQHNKLIHTLAHPVRSYRSYAIIFSICRASVYMCARCVCLSLYLSRSTCSRTSRAHRLAVATETDQSPLDFHSERFGFWLVCKGALCCSDNATPPSGGHQANERTAHTHTVGFRVRSRAQSSASRAFRVRACGVRVCV